MFCDRSFASETGLTCLGNWEPRYLMGISSLSLFSTASAHHANKDYEMTIMATIFFPTCFIFGLIFFFSLCSAQVLFTIPPFLLNYARRLLGQKRRIPLGRAELQATNSLAYQFICATGVLALDSLLVHK